MALGNLELQPTTTGRDQHKLQPRGDQELALSVTLSQSACSVLSALCHSARADESTDGCRQEPAVSSWSRVHNLEPVGLKVLTAARWRWHDGAMVAAVPSSSLRTNAPAAASKEDRDIARHRINRAAGLAKLHPQTLREYERQGLLRPERTDGGMRLYRDRDIAVARRVRALTDEGVPFSAVDRMLRLERRVSMLISVVRVLEDQNMVLSTRLQAAAVRSL